MASGLYSQSNYAVAVERDEFLDKPARATIATRVSQLEERVTELSDALNRLGVSVANHDDSIAMLRKEVNI